MKNILGLIVLFLYPISIYSGVIANKEIFAFSYHERICCNSVLDDKKIFKSNEVTFSDINATVVVNKCSVNYIIDREGLITGKTDSKDLFEESHYRDFTIFDDDGFISQVIVFNKLYKTKDKGLLINDEDLEILLMATDRAINYSSSEKVLNNPKIKSDDKINLEYILFFNTAFKDHLLRIKSSKKEMSKTTFDLWAHYTQGQRYEHFYTLKGFTAEPTRGIINASGAFPPSVPQCCYLKIAELNNIIAMSLFNINFITGEKMTKMYSQGITKCEDGYEVTYRLAKNE